MSYNFLTLLLTLFLRDHNVSLRAADNQEDLTQILRICIFTHENHTPKGNAYAEAPFEGTFLDKVYAKNLPMKTQPYGKLTQHACLTTPLRNLTLFRFFAYVQVPYDKAFT